MNVGQNIARIRSFQGIKQEDMARRLKISQQAYSKLERSEEVSDDLIQKIASESGCTPEVIKELGNAQFVQSFNQNCANVVAYQFNPVEKIVSLYEELLKSEREKIALLESLLKNKKG
ncbi:MAG TPA: helix-turn-helix transcriptional regulator [Edaphocola sp.]|nr:helix-turn-helix transcriptional regulator [Edaphocola sp.]